LILLDRRAVPYGVAFVWQAFSDHYSVALGTHVASVFSRHICSIYESYQPSAHPLPWHAGWIPFVSGRQSAVSGEQSRE